MNICCISDSHGLHRELDESMPDDCQVLVHAGDLCNRGTLKELIDAAEWLKVQAKRYPYVVAIAGNHDFSAEAFYKEGREDVLRDIFGPVHYLRDSEVTIDGVCFFGSPWSPRFFDWAFNADRGVTIKRYWDSIPAYTNILVSHGPPIGILDRVGNEHVGCADLLTAVERIKPAAHIFGHIHSGHGQKTLAGTQYINASVLNDDYRHVHTPTVIEI